MTPPQNAINAALVAARRSPCGKSKRGVAVFLNGRYPHVYGVGFNGMPGDAACTNDDACRRLCARRCVHAETRAIRSARLPPFPSRDFDAVHVKISTAGDLVPSGGPSCWQCSREVLDVGLAGFWLYERNDECPSDRCPLCTGANCSACYPGPGRPRCDHDVIERHSREPDPPPGVWRRYTAAEFHAATLLSCGLVP